MFELGTIAFFVFGAIVGSFVNVVTLRAGFTESRRARSACMACSAPLTAADLVPVISYMALRGRCRSCGSRLSIQYPLVELAVAALFALSFAQAYPLLSFESAAAFAALLTFWAAFAGLIAYDIRHTLVPLPFAYVLIGAAAVVRGAQGWGAGSFAPLIDAGLGALALGGFILLLVLVTRGRGMGAGDVYIAVAMGILFGFAYGVEVMALAFWVGAVVGIVLLIAKRGVSMKSEVPFAPFLMSASVLAAFTAFSPLTMIAHLTESLWK